MNTVRRIAVVCLMLCISGCDPQSEETSVSVPSSVVLRGHAMGTTWRIDIVDAVDDQAAIQSKCESLIESLELQMSHWRTESELSRFNDWDSLEPFAISRELAEVVEEAQRIHELSDGAFDVTSGPLVNVWGFGPAGRTLGRPSPSDIESALALVGHANLSLVRRNDGASELSKLRPDVRLDLSGLAKGYAIDKLADSLDLLGIKNYLVEFGGELRARGVNASGRVWRIGLEQPNRSLTRKVRSTIELDNMAVATSGNYRNFTKDPDAEISQCHIIDPRTGYPVRHRLVSVSVVAKTAMTADAWATALMVLGPNEGFERAQELELNATFLIRSGNTTTEKRTQHGQEDKTLGVSAMSEKAPR